MDIDNPKESEENNGSDSLVKESEENNGSDSPVKESGENNGSDSLVKESGENNGSDSLVKESEENNGSDSPVKENGHLQPVPPDTSGVGFPYAPENFPKPGDDWRWRVGKRVAITGHYLDRYLYAPKSLRHLLKLRLKHGFASKLSVERFVRDEFPDADINAFFESFSWKIPSKKLQSTNGAVPDRRTFFAVPHKESPEPSSSDPGSAGCKARNRACISLTSGSDRPEVSTMPCDICCSEPGFCRDCCCILCSKTVDFSHGGYSFIRCEALVEEGSVCGHLAHLNCGLRTYMAGTVGGSIALDAEYYCRRCDARTELVSHVMKSLQTCKAIDSQDKVEEVLNMAVSVLSGSQKTSAKLLLSSIYSALSKLKRGSSLDEIWKEDGSLAAHISSNGSGPSLLINDDGPPLEASESKKLPDSSQPKGDPSNDSDSSSSQLHYQKLETDVNQVLQAMRDAQESEYRLAEERLHAQKNYLHNLHQQLGHEIREQTELGPSGDPSVLVNCFSKRKDQIKREYEKFVEMKEVAKGFGRTSKRILREHFGMGSE